MTAARPGLLGSGLPRAMKWRTVRGGTPLHKFSMISRGTPVLQGRETKCVCEVQATLLPL
ncbi:hypothetical protein Airi02_014890 [Actinoallomurus iriomotensis]|uniref:Uncharacterized protein n=1 Tax=Actinoallomurus iriomotensis TaxID=478107 RepID=A0A9W6VXS4_9ACTN|nr:hypothetical protein Airi02_014890 [Actinoallomurus iriomotensis]